VRKSEYQKQVDEKNAPPANAASGSGASGAAAPGPGAANQGLSLMQQLDPMAVRLLGKDRALDQFRAVDAKEIATKAGIGGAKKKATKQGNALVGVALARAQQGADEAYGDATLLLAKVAKAATIDDLKAEEATLNDTVQRLKGKADVYLDNGDEESDEDNGHDD
jgi:hypothetical protein